MDLVCIKVDRMVKKVPKKTHQRSVDVGHLHS